MIEVKGGEVMTEIVIPIHGQGPDSDPIVVRLADDGMSGSITSSLKEVCPVCNQADCYASCDLSQADESDIPESTESEEDIDNRKQFNAAMDGIESTILGHAIAGYVIDDPAYVEGIETAWTACGNNFS